MRYVAVQSATVRDASRTRTAVFDIYRKSHGYGRYLGKVELALAEDGTYVCDRDLAEGSRWLDDDILTALHQIAFDDLPLHLQQIINACNLASAT